MINYYLLTKPGIIMGNLITLAAGFLLASQGTIHVALFFWTLIGLGLIMASACVFNNYIDRQIDQKMARTRNRPLVTGKISARKAILFAILLGCVGHLVLFVYTNLLTLCIATLGFLMYVVVYSLWKGRTVYGTAIGSISGSIPPIVGYCAVSNQIDWGVPLLFAIMVFWQMPHFFSIAMYRIEDYLAASIPVLPVVKGAYRTKLHMVLYIACFMVMTTLLTLMQFTGYLFLSVTLVVGGGWLVLGLKGFKSGNDPLWARKMFYVSLIVIFAICFTMPL